MQTVATNLKAGLREGLLKGWQSFVWVLKLIVPISLATALLQYSGVLAYLDRFLAPVTHLLGLPAAAAVPMVIGPLAGVYAAVGAMAVLPLTQAQMTLVAIFVLIAHLIIQEGIIQARAGFRLGLSALVRLGAGFLTVLVAGWFLADDGRVASVMPAAVALRPTLEGMLLEWGTAMAWLAFKILLIVMTIMISLAWMRRFDLIRHLVGALRPVLVLLGLRPQVAVLWLSAVLFGLLYGAAVIVEEVREGSFDPRDLERLHVSIGINHSMIEDPVLFLPLGIGAFWLWIPRLVAAMVAVRLYDLAVYLRRQAFRPARHRL
jgi:spore maturation protein SpmB